MVCCKPQDLKAIAKAWIWFEFCLSWLSILIFWIVTKGLFFTSIPLNLINFLLVSSTVLYSCLKFRAARGITRGTNSWLYGHVSLSVFYSWTYGLSALLCLIFCIESSDSLVGGGSLIPHGTYHMEALYAGISVGLCGAVYFALQVLLFVKVAKHIEIEKFQGKEGKWHQLNESI